MKPYKYEVGDEVTYSEIRRKEKTCETCGHTEEDIWYEDTRNKIEERMYDTVHNLSNGFMDLESKRDENGMVIHTPSFAKLEVTQQEPVYKINNRWYVETSLK